MNEKDRVRLPDRVEAVTDDGDFDPAAEVVRDVGGRAYDEAHLEQLADEARQEGPPQVRRGRPALGSTGGHSPRLSTRVPQEIDDAVRAAAAEEGVTPAQWLREAIERRLVG